MVSLHKASRLAAWDFSARRDCCEVVHGEGMGVPTSLSTLFPIGQCAQWGINSSSLQDCIPQSCQQRPRMSVPTAGCIVSNLSLGELEELKLWAWAWEGPAHLGLVSGLPQMAGPTSLDSGTAAAIEKGLVEGP